MGRGVAWVGLGGGADAVAMRYAEEGCHYTSNFLHPRLARHRDGAPHLWRRRRVTDRESQPYPGVSCRGHPGRHAFAFVGCSAGAEAGPGPEDEMWGEEEEEGEEEMEEEEGWEDREEGWDEEMEGEGGGAETGKEEEEVEDVEAQQEDIDNLNNLDRDRLLACLDELTKPTSQLL